MAKGHIAILEDKILKDNIIKLAKHHKANCNRENCEISLLSLLTVAERAGIKFTTEEVMVIL